MNFESWKEKRDPNNNKQSMPSTKNEQKKPHVKNEQKPKPTKANVGWLFYKEYFQDLDYADLKNTKNKELINKRVAHMLKQPFSNTKQPSLGNVAFELKTTYPGLLLGSGNTHELPDIEGQAILGFHFDYTSGFPEIAGSSLKGVLRSAFEHPEYIKDVVKNEMLDVAKLAEEIFENGDIFFDAVIIKGNPQNRFLGDDYITPHKEATKDPIPLRFIKVLPEVSFRFAFSLHDGSITKEQKEALFKQIILDFGLGAKTNVGYGKFAE